MTQPTTAAIRHYLTAAYSDDELTALCADYFRDVSDAFAAGMTKTQKTQLLLDHCQRRELLPYLFAALSEDRPAQYQQQFGPVAIEPALASAPRARDPRQIFISHAHEDADFAHRLATDLKAHGWRVWLVPDSIRPGEKWGEAINRGLEECGVFVVVLTPAAVRSRWVTTETTLAIELEHKDVLRFIPVEITSCRPPVLWTAYQYITCMPRYDSSLAALLAALDERSALTPAVQPPPVVTPPVRPAKPAQPQPAVTFPPRRSSTPPLRRPLAPPPPASFVVTVPIHLEFIRIPIGDFLMGSDPTQDKHARPNEQPQRRLHPSEFYIGKYPVTNDQYAAFMKATGYRIPDHWKSGQVPVGKDDHPVVSVSWYDAVAFCAWLSQATDQPIRLPTEAEWEKAARGLDGRLYPWGNHAPDVTLCNFANNVRDTTPVDSYPAGASPYGVLNMAGNVHEWCSSLWGANADKPTFGYPYRAGDGRENPHKAGLRILRGGSWGSDPECVRCAFRLRYSPYSGGYDVGFRVAWSSQ